MRDFGVSVTILMPGANGEDTKYENNPAEVARHYLEALMSGKRSEFSESLLTKIQGYALKIFPEEAKA